MDRQPHDYGAASAMAFAQQQRQQQQQQQQPQQQQQQPFGYPPPPPQQQFHGPSPPFLPPHPSLQQQFPYHHHLQQQPQQVHTHPHPPPPPHLLHLQQQQQPPSSPFPPHLPPPPLVPSPFHGFYDSASPAPPPSAPPSDPELHKRIDKLVEYSAKNGPEFEAMIREKQQDNPDYSFLFGGEGHGYYRYKLWLSTRPPPGGSFNPPPPFAPSSLHMMRPPPNPMLSPSPLNAPPMGGSAAAAMMGGPQMHQPPYFYEQQHQHPPQSFGVYGRPDYDQSSKPFKGLSGPLPSDVAVELNNVLLTLNGTKESIKGAKFWFMQRSIFAPALAEALRDRVFAVDDSERQLHIIYLANDILFDSSHRRTGDELDNEAHAFKPVLGSMLGRIYHNPQIKEENQLKLQQILQLWASNNIYDQDTISALRNEMIGGISTNSFSGPSKELSTASAESATGLPLQTTNHSVSQWQPGQGAVSSLADQERSDKHALPGQTMPPVASQQFLPGAVPPVAFPGAMPITSPVQLPNQQAATHLLPGQSANNSEKVPPYPLFPPGLIPGMVRKMQIGSGVPYSPMSPLDIPTVIPPSTVSQSEILERVSKFFKEIGEVNPSEGPVKSDAKDEDDDYEYERESPVRKGGACIPPPPNLQLDPETGTYADGSVDRKPGFGSSGRLGLGATANPNEVSQYDDVYSSYRKQRSTTYHSSMSARAAAR